MPCKRRTSTWVALTIGSLSVRSTPGDPRPFLGIYNGNGYTISHLKISNMQDEFAVGLFGRTDGDALLTGIHLRDVEISMRNKGHTVGTLVGISRGASTVSLCSAQGKINTSDINPTVGGLVGLNEGTITRCRTDVEITVDRVNLGGVHLTAGAGGIVGINEYSGPTICLPRHRQHHYEGKCI